MKINTLDIIIIKWLQKSFLPFARIAIFVIYFYFGALKLFGQSPATPLATSLAANTFGLQHFDLMYKILAIFECLIGILFLFPKAIRIVIPMLFVHLIIVCLPLLLIPHLVWVKPLVPTLEGQYVIKNIAIIALAIGIAAQTKPLVKKSLNR
ncbi:MAG TPA: hypothetical protein VLF79_03175 [Candidatus Saccharimonadales bacterium]|nr:hypothetical protein [Candidatus Saccharimonadales bacterium]